MWLSCVCPGACIFYARVCVVVCFLDAFSCAVRRRKGREKRCSCFFFISIDQKGKLQIKITSSNQKWRAQVIFECTYLLYLHRHACQPTSCRAVAKEALNEQTHPLAPTLSTILHWQQVRCSYCIYCMRCFAL